MTQHWDPWSAGCSALSWDTGEGKHLFGRNFDFSRLAEGSGVSYVPRKTAYRLGGTELCQARYAAAGMGFLEMPDTPILYEGINEKGLMGSQLYYRGFAHFPTELRPGTAPLEPPLAVYHLLAQCASVAEAAELVEQEVTLLGRPMLGTVPPLHWAFRDTTGETMVIEPDADGVKLYRHTLGVMTNSPGYPWHRLNLLNYAGIRDLDYDGLELEGERLEQCFSGSGAQGLPGDWSSPSRFVRLAFLKRFCAKGQGEEEAVTRLFRVMQSAAFPLGMVRVTEQGHVTQYDEDVSPYDYTIYTAVMCGESLRYYWTTYENMRVQYVDLNQLMRRGEALLFPLERRADFLQRQPEEGLAKKENCQGMQNIVE